MKITNAAWRGAAKTGLATLAWVLLHSALASRAAKRRVALRIGQERTDRYYRAFFNVQSAATAGALALYTRSLPDQTLYEAKGGLRKVLRAVQAAGALWLLNGVLDTGAARLSGAAQLLDALRGKSAWPPTEGQGPLPDRNGVLQTGGLYRWSRHPLNVAPLPLLWGFPRMSVRLVVFNVVSTIYFYVGSVHEEARLREVYGESYEIYQRRGAPMFLPSPPTLSGPSPREGTASAALPWDGRGSCPFHLDM